MIKQLLLSAILMFTVTGCIKIVKPYNPMPEKAYSSDKDVLMFILDGSGSMTELDNSGKVKMLGAKNTLKDIAYKLDNEKTNVGLIGFSSGCRSAKLLIEPTNNNLAYVVRVSEGMKARGRTPLAMSIRKAGEVLRNIKKKVNIIIISDGVETCGGDPVAEARRLKSYGIDSRLYIIGYAVNRATRSQLESIAHAGGGAYYVANDGASLSKVITDITDELDIKSDKWKGDVYKFKINFDSSSSTLKKESYGQIKDFATYLINTNNSAELQGHTDSQGSLKANKTLSQKRAQSVVDKLISYNVPKNNVYAVGFGELAPISDNETKEGRYENRRVEAHVIKDGVMDVTHINQANSRNVVNINNATNNYFIGYYKVTDPTRSYAKYHVWMELYANAQGVYGEYINNKSVVKVIDNKIAWAFDKSLKNITLDYSDNGKKVGWAEFKGKLSGNTNKFNLSGHWGNGKNGKILMQRISIEELKCMKQIGIYKDGVCRAY